MFARKRNKKSNFLQGFANVEKFNVGCLINKFLLINFKLTKFCEYSEFQILFFCGVDYAKYHIAATPFVILYWEEKLFLDSGLMYISFAN